MTTLGISLSFTWLSLTPWPSLGTLGTIFPIRAGFGVLGIIFPMRGFAAGECSEARGGFAWLSDDDLVADFCGRTVVVPNPVKSSSWRKHRKYNLLVIIIQDLDKSCNDKLMNQSPEMNRQLF